MRTLNLASTSLLALAAAVATALPARAAYIVTFAQVGPDVVASGSGTIDTNGLTLVGFFGAQALIASSLPAEATGTGSIDLYTATVSGPSNFGSGGITDATAGTGGLAGFDSSQIVVPLNYVSGSPLADTATYSGQTFASLGLTPGSYVYSFGSGVNADTITVDIGTPIPEPASLALLGAGLAGLGMIQRKAR